MESPDAEQRPKNPRRVKRAQAIAAALLITVVAATVWKIAQPTAAPREATDQPVNLRPCPDFELHDQTSEIVRLSRYLGRHEMLLVFFDGDAGVEADAWLKALILNHEAVESSGTIVLGISGALPQQHRQTKCPFPLLTDLDPRTQSPSSRFGVHRRWGLLDAVEGSPVSGVFHVTRDGKVEWDGGFPKPLAAPEYHVRRLIQGRP